MVGTLLAQDEFRNYGPSHLAALAVFVAGAVLVVRWGRRLRGGDKDWR